MLDKLLSACDSRYQRERHNCTCRSCTYDGFCPNDGGECESCLELVHFPDRISAGAPPRHYDCTHMADYYVCKYACKYVSELVYAFERLRDLQSKRELKVLSFGCGPCTDLLALDYLRNTGVYKYMSLEYRGVDYGEDIWHKVHQDLKNITPKSHDLKFFYSDARKLVDRIATGRWTPNLVVFQYFFSDMNKNATRQEITDFIDVFAEYANIKMGDGSYIVFNDINLSIGYGGGREYFDRLLNCLDDGHHDTGHFHNNNRPNTYGYGDEFSDNRLFFDTTSLSMYRPFESCSSAQMIYKKEGAFI